MPNLDQPDAERITDALLERLAIPLDHDRLVAAVDDLLDAGTIHAAPPFVAAVVSRPLTPRELAAAAAATLAEARTTAAASPDHDAPARALALVAVATEYRQLGTVVNGAVNMQPEQEGTN